MYYGREFKAEKRLLQRFWSLVCIFLSVGLLVTNGQYIIGEKVVDNWVAATELFFFFIGSTHQILFKVVPDDEV
jgi:hypothetical protein